MTYPFRPQMPPYPFVPPFDPPDEEPPYIPPDSSTSGDEPDGSSSVDPGPRPDWWPDDWEWPPEPEEPIEVLVPPPLPNIIWPVHRRPIDEITLRSIQRLVILQAHTVGAANINAGN